MLISLESSLQGLNRLQILFLKGIRSGVVVISDLNGFNCSRDCLDEVALTLECFETRMSSSLDVESSASQ